MVMEAINNDNTRTKPTKPAYVRGTAAHITMIMLIHRNVYYTRNKGIHCGAILSEVLQPGSTVNLARRPFSSPYPFQCVKTQRRSITVWPQNEIKHGGIALATTQHIFRYMRRLNSVLCTTRTTGSCTAVCILVLSASVDRFSHDAADCPLGFHARYCAVF